MKKLVCIIVSVVVMLTTLTACGPNVQNNNDDNSTKTILNVYNFNGGVGSEWIDTIEKWFEKEYAETCFEPGTSKKGVDVKVAKGTDVMTGNLKEQTYSVVFTEAVSVFGLASSGDLLPITDLVTSSLSDVTGGQETGTIEDKLDGTLKGALKAVNNEYYMLPHYETYAGVSYDVKVFEDYGLYFKQGGGWTSSKEEMTVGPDGRKGTYDDGLASSVEEFSLLMKKISDENVTPFVWATAYDNYTSRFLIGMEASLCGYDQYQLNYNFGKDSSVTSGKADIITGFENGKPIISKGVDITPANGYLMNQNVGKYYAIKLFEEILSKSYYYEDSDSTLGGEMAQGQYIYSDLTGDPIAMLIEGSYWYNEGEDYFTRSESMFKDRAKNRKFAWMPLPVQIEGSVKEGEYHTQTLVNANCSYAFINANVKNNANTENLAKLFFKYCYTNKALVDFFLTTGLFKGVSTDMTGIDISSLENYKQSIYYTKQNSKVSHVISDNKITIADFKQEIYDWASMIDGTTYDFPIQAFTARDKKDAEKYFKGMWKTKNEWNEKYSNYLD